MPFLRGLMPIRRTLYYLEKGDIYLRNEVKILTVTFNPEMGNSKGAREFVFWHWEQLQYKNPYVQLVKFRRSFPIPYIQAFLEDGSEVLMDLDNYTRQDVHDRLSRILGKTKNILEHERVTTAKAENPAYFGESYPRQCICEMQGQQPCPSVVPLPDYMRGKWRWNKNLC
ncbi:L51 S25 CI-B8 domain containing protein [Trichuris trichiura]|uniref:Small ribosomal subunit protein mS25 n=1 Tax=Trichuris trichiura TaxID=36087 RepID=A0A077ZEI7_TRITR|nr:L51 S25 CI-B8 domain containing protein [Trichuris trichiura]